ncbi:MAG: tetratricopeptide repeat protein [Oligoflexales bacterium]|nr:tetratricopeptide repeat protein [Oligoflexales bacterium]
MRSDLHFLIIDDDFAKSNAMRMHFSKLGYRHIHVLPDGYHALESIIENYGDYDFILCKYKLADMLSIELLEELKNNLSIERIPFLVFSDDWDHQDLALVVEKGADATLNVPYISKDLAEKISTTWSRYIDPNNVEYHFELGRRYFLAKKYKRALEIFSEIERSQTFLSRSRNAKAQIFFAQGDLEKAIELCTKIIANDPDFVHAHQLMGQAFIKLEKYLEAVKSLVNAIQISPKNPFRYKVVGSILSKLNKWEDLIVIMRIAEEAGLEHAFVKEYLAKALIAIDQKPEAIDYYKELTELYPNNVVYLNNLAVCYKNSDELQKAVQIYKKACNLEPNNLSLKFNLALAYLAQDKSEQTISLLQSILKLNPEHKKAHAKLLMLADPKACKVYVEEEKKLADQNVIKLKPGHQKLKISENEEKEIDAIIKSIEKKNRFLKKVMSPDKRCINAKSLKILGSKSTPVLQEQYMASLCNIRKKFEELMNSWFNPIKTISEEICSDISGIIKHISKDIPSEPNEIGELADTSKFNSSDLHIALEKELQNNTALKEELYPIVLQLQFQDYLTQALDGISKIFPLPMPIADLKALLQEKEGYLVQGEDRNLFKEIVLKEDASTHEEEKAGDMILF